MATSGRGSADADRRAKLLIYQAIEGSILGAYLHPQSTSERAFREGKRPTNQAQGLLRFIFFCRASGSSNACSGTSKASASRSNVKIVGFALRFSILEISVCSTSRDPANDACDRPDSLRSSRTLSAKIRRIAESRVGNRSAKGFCFGFCFFGIGRSLIPQEAIRLAIISTDLKRERHLDDKLG
jgi:hypothetical protein